METEDFEIKSDFDGSSRHWLRLAKTVVSMANTSGGLIGIESLSNLNIDQMDPARLDNLIHKFVDPRIDDIRVHQNESVNGKTYLVLITVPNSNQKPHVITSGGQYTDDKGRHHWEFYPGQIWVRHSAGNAPATEDDIDRIFRGRLSLLLTQLGAAVVNLPIGTWVESGTGMPFHLTDDPSAPRVSFIYPYTASSLGGILGRSQHWVSKTADALGWRPNGGPNAKFMQAIPSADGSYVQQWRYSQEAKAELESLISNDPGFVP